MQILVVFCLLNGILNSLLGALLSLPGLFLLEVAVHLELLPAPSLFFKLFHPLVFKKSFSLGFFTYRPFLLLSPGVSFLFLRPYLKCWYLVLCLFSLYLPSLDKAIISCDFYQPPICDWSLPCISRLGPFIWDTVSLIWLPTSLPYGCYLDS